MGWVGRGRREEISMGKRRTATPGPVSRIHASEGRGGGRGGR